ncbi:MAG: S8 family serine peptidase [Motiliproteus sp.]
MAYFEPNGVAWAFPKPPWAGGGDDSDSGGQTVPYGITRVGGTQNGSGLHAWVIDTGIDLDHADLNVGNGKNFVLRGKNSADDGDGHGTHVAGIIGALDNDLDVVGVAAGAILHPVRVLDNSGSGTIDGVVAGVDWVAANASSGDCANMSLGARGSFASLEDAVANAANTGIRFALAAGNSSDDANNFSPAKVNGTNIYTVSAIDDNDDFASFSNYGNPPVDFAAPGVSVLSTKKGGGTTTKSGTSMAAPHVCGLLLFGAPNSDGTANYDPDGDPDPIAHK